MSAFLIFFPYAPTYIPLFLHSPLKWILRQQFPDLIVPALPWRKHLVVLDFIDHFHLFPLPFYFPDDLQRVGCRGLTIMDYFTNSRMWIFVREFEIDSVEFVSQQHRWSVNNQGFVWQDVADLQTGQTIKNCIGIA